MPSDAGTYTLENILRNLRGAGQSPLVPRAYAFTAQAHGSQRRLSGERYLDHPAAAALYLAQAGADPTTVAAALLHDTLEDTAVTANELEAEFGPEILFLVQGVTKIGSYKYHGPEGAHKNLRRLVQAATQDIRVIAIKLYDRLHNMQTNAFHTPERAFRKAEETLNTYVPLADRLGMGHVRRLLEDLAFPYVDKESYTRMRKLVGKERKSKHPNMEKVMRTLSKAFESRHQIVSKIEIREKSLWSLYRKIERKKGNVHDIHDIFAIRIVVPSKDECYDVLGTVHSCFKPIPGQFKDYIGLPKPNGYQSLHTTVITPQAGIVEVQIRSRIMHTHALYGNIGSDVKSG